MNNQNRQNNLIISIVCGVLALVGAGIIFFNKPTPVAPPEPENVPTVTVALPAGLVTKTKGLPAGNNNQGQPGGIPGPAGASGGMAGGGAASSGPPTRPVAAGAAGGGAPSGGPPTRPVAAGTAGN